MDSNHLNHKVPTHVDSLAGRRMVALHVVGLVVVNHAYGLERVAPVDDEQDA